jgi:hypothetical protein
VHFDELHEEKDSEIAGSGRAGSEGGALMRKYGPTYSYWYSYSYSNGVFQ